MIGEYIIYLLEHTNHSTSYCVVSIKPETRCSLQTHISWSDEAEIEACKSALALVL